MFASILTWIGAILGLTVLLAMAFGAYVFDIGDAVRRWKRKGRELPDPTQSSTV